MNKPVIHLFLVLVFVLLLPALFSACVSSEKQTLPAPSKLISERRLEDIKKYGTLIIGIAPSPLQQLEQELISAVLKDTGFRFRIVEAPPEVLFSFLRTARADIICGLFTEKELEKSYLTPVMPFLKLSFYILHSKEFKESVRTGKEGEVANTEELLYPDSAPENLVIQILRSNLSKRPMPYGKLFEEMNRVPSKRAVFLCNIFVPKQKNLIIRKAEFNVPVSNQLSFALRRNDPELYQLLTARFNEISSNGTLQLILSQYTFLTENRVNHEKR